MAEDIAPELLRRVQSEYRESMKADRELARIREKIEAGTASGKDLDAFAVRSGELLAQALQEHVSGDILPNGRMYYNIANRLLPPVLRQNYEDVADVSDAIQTIMNEQAGIGIKAQRPELNEDRVEGLVNLAAEAEQYEDIRKELEGDVVNFSQSVATDSVKSNAEFQYQSGLSPKVERTAEPSCCPWCQNLEGTYDYADIRGTGNEVWKRHRACRCVVEYVAAGKRQNAHTKMTYADRDARAERVARAQEAEKQDKGQEQAEREDRIETTRRYEQEERNRKIHYGESMQFERDKGYTGARAVDNYARNHIFISDDVTISPREIRWINNSVTDAKNILGIAEQCNIPVVIVSDSDKLASYNPRTNTIFISSKMADRRTVLEMQVGYAAPDNPNSTMVHELIHWQDAEDYRRNIGEIESAEPQSEYSIFQRNQAEIALKNAGINLADREQVRGISRYAYDNLLVNDFEEIYTEFRTKNILGG